VQQEKRRKKRISDFCMQAKKGILLQEKSLSIRIFCIQEEKKRRKRILDFGMRSSFK
jgi:hypothetical protein